MSLLAAFFAYVYALGLSLADLDPAIVLSAIINLGSAIAVIVVVVKFLAFIERMNGQNGISIERLAKVIEALEAKIDSHDDKVSAGIARMEERTRPRDRDGLR